MLGREIPREEWARFLDTFSKQHEGWIANVEAVDRRLGDQEESTRLPLVGISADKGRQPRIELIVGGRPEAHLTHTINGVKRIWLKPPEEPAHEAIEVEAEDGTITLLTFQHVPPTQPGRQLPGSA
jgi:hypothetical protein